MVLNRVEGDTERLMREGQAAAKRGDKVMARALLTQLLERDPHNEQAWMWLSGVVVDLEEQQTCLENVLIINPGNAQAKKGLEFISAKTGIAPRLPVAAVESAPAPARAEVPPSYWPGVAASPPTTITSTLLPEMPHVEPAPASMHTAPGGDEFTQLLADVAGAIEAHVDSEPQQGMPQGLPFMPAIADPSPAAPEEVTVPSEPSLADFALPDLSAGGLPPWAQMDAPPQASSANGSNGHDSANGHAPAPAAEMASAVPSLPVIPAMPGPAPSGSEAQGAPQAAGAAAPEAASPDPFEGLEGITPFELPADAGESLYTGGPATPGAPPDLRNAIPEWVLNPAAEIAGMPEAERANEAQPEAHDTGAALTDAPSEMGAVPAPSSGADLQPDLNAWLEQMAGSATPVVQQAPAAPAPAPVPQPAEPAFADPFAGGPGFQNDPFLASHLPSPDELPGGHSEPVSSGQPWYVQSSGSAVESPPDYAYGSGAEYEHDGGDVPVVPARPVERIPCPNCHTPVPETNLACPQCNFSFFVHCPRCHELVDTSDARPGVIDPCPYCGHQINRLEMGLINIQGISSAAPEIVGVQMEQWTGEPTAVVHRTPMQVLMGLATDFVVLVVIILMVWALSQLPTWFNLTNLYN